MRVINVAAAQLGPIQNAGSRETVVKRMIATQIWLSPQARRFDPADITTDIHLRPSARPAAGVLRKLASCLTMATTNPACS
jgi:hypothetical protein